MKYKERNKNFSHISVVIQGPVSCYQGREQNGGITQKCIESIRKYLPGSIVILSTWKGQDCDGLDPDILLLNEDPGGNIVAYNKDGEAQYLNYNRQIISTLSGLKRVKTPYVVKIRSDNFLTNNSFVYEQQKYKKRIIDNIFFDERVVVNTSYFRLFADGHKVIMHPSDFFHYGLTTDVMKIWDLPLFDDIVFDDTNKGTIQHPWAPNISLHAEQVYCQRWLNILDSESPILTHRYDASNELIDYWFRFIASNFIVLEPEQIGLGLINRFVSKIKRPNEISFFDWLFIYKKYCDNTIYIPYFKYLFHVGIHRWVKMEIKKLIKR